MGEKITRKKKRAQSVQVTSICLWSVPPTKQNLKFGARMILVACPYYPMMIVRR